MKDNTQHEMNRIPEYEGRIAALSAQLALLTRQYNQLSWARLVVFLGAIGIDYLLFQWNTPVGLAGGMILLVLFLYLIRWHTVVAEKREHNQRLLSVNEAEILSLKGEWKDRSDGIEFRDYDHPYSYDLDFFGRGSVFQFINRTGTSIGRNALAEGLKNPLQSVSEIRLRQDAVAELAEKPAWNLNFQALGMGKTDTAENSRSLLAWLEEKPYFTSQSVYPRLIWILPGLFFLSLLGWLIPTIPELGISQYQIPGSVALMFFLINLGVVGINLGRVGRQQVQVGKKSEMLRKYADLLAQIEGEAFVSPLLRQDYAMIVKDGVPASEQIKQLGDLTYMLDQRLNAFMGLLLNGILLWDIRYVLLLEKWRETHKADLPVWFEIISRWDALGSFARFRYNYADLIFPEVSEGAFFMKAEQLGHPLLDAGIRINNDVELAKPGEFLIITGANMAGKSTFLRTVGVNLILAMNGAPVCAKNYAFSPIEMITSVRTQDSLSDNESYFYAELKQLKKIIDKLKEGRPVFVIVDEMLRGTNSKDKMIGSRKFIEQLIQLNAVGLVATHDLSLGKLADDYPDFARNKRFEVEITGDLLTFDYKLMDGISQNLNATFLMQKMGIMP
ncbi:MAG: hypothetical protein R3D00_06170 [Bacteroidia bacterium]